MGCSMEYNVEAGRVYYFLKEGVWVKAVKAMGDSFWHVKRVEDGKSLLAPTWALSEDAEAFEGEPPPDYLAQLNRGGESLEGE